MCLSLYFSHSVLVFILSFSLSLSSSFLSPFLHLSRLQIKALAHQPIYSVSYTVSLSLSLPSTHKSKIPPISFINARVHVGKEIFFSLLPSSSAKKKRYVSVCVCKRVCASYLSLTMNKGDCTFICMYISAQACSYQDRENPYPENTVLHQ